MIAAIDRNNSIGYKGQLLEKVSADMTRFKNLTMHGIVVMGRKTFESLPNGPLPDRVNIVLTSNEDFRVNNALVVYSFEQLIGVLSVFNSSKIFVIGGGEVYKLLMDYCDTLYITRFDRVYSSDTMFPLISSDEWKLVNNSGTFTNGETGTEYSFWDYERKGLPPKSIKDGIGL